LVRGERSRLKKCEALAKKKPHAGEGSAVFPDKKRRL
jgi:hypothetical protein